MKDLSPILVEAQSQMKEGHYKTAIQLFNEHLKDQPKDIKSQLQLGVCHLLNQDKNEFISIYELVKIKLPQIEQLESEVRILWLEYQSLFKKIVMGSMFIAQLTQTSCSDVMDDGAVMKYGVQFSRPVYKAHEHSLDRFWIQVIDTELLPLPSIKINFLDENEKKIGEEYRTLERGISLDTFDHDLIPERKSTHITGEDPDQYLPVKIMDTFLTGRVVVLTKDIPDDEISNKKTIKVLNALGEPLLNRKVEVYKVVNNREEYFKTLNFNGKEASFEDKKIDLKSTYRFTLFVEDDNKYIKSHSRSFNSLTLEFSTRQNTYTIIDSINF